MKKIRKKEKEDDIMLGNYRIRTDLALETREPVFRI